MFTEALNTCVVQYILYVAWEDSISVLAKSILKLIIVPSDKHVLELAHLRNPTALILAALF